MDNNQKIKNLLDFIIEDCKTFKESFDEFDQMSKESITAYLSINFDKIQRKIFNEENEISEFEKGQLSEICYMIKRGRPASTIRIQEKFVESAIEYVTNEGLKTYTEHLDEGWKVLWIYKELYTPEIILAIREIDIEQDTAFYHWCLGKLFGYDDKSIRAFILKQVEISYNRIIIHNSYRKYQKYPVFKIWVYGLLQNLDIEFINRQIHSYFKNELQRMQGMGGDKINEE